MDTHSGAPDVASEPEATESSRFLQLIRLQDGSAENGSEFLPTELLPLLLDFLPVDEVVMFDVRAVSRFFASPKAWVFHLFKLMDIDSLPTLSSEKQMHPIVECFHKCLEVAEDEPEIQERRSRLTREDFLGTSERCRGMTCVERMISEKSSLQNCRFRESMNCSGWITADWHTDEPAYIEFRRGRSHHHDHHDHDHHHHHHHHHCTYKSITIHPILFLRHCFRKPLSLVSVYAASITLKCFVRIHHTLHKIS